MGAGASAGTTDPGLRTLSLADLSDRWRVIAFAVSDAATNMAVDAALLDDARRTGTATLRVYGWATPTLSLGRHERTRGRFTPNRLADAGVDVVRRVTGGRALLHDHEVTYSIAAPAGDGGLRERFATINALLTSALDDLGVRANSAPRRAPSVAPGVSACFSEPNEGELVVDDLKLVASAQIREANAFLQHGSILLSDDQYRIASLADDPLIPPTRAACLTTLLGRPVSPAEVEQALATALHTALARSGVTLPPVLESVPGSAGAILQHRVKFLDPGWTWHR